MCFLKTKQGILAYKKNKRFQARHVAFKHGINWRMNFPNEQLTFIICPDYKIENGYIEIMFQQFFGFAEYECMFTRYNCRLIVHQTNVDTILYRQRPVFRLFKGARTKLIKTKLIN